LFGATRWVERGKVPLNLGGEELTPANAAVLKRAVDLSVGALLALLALPVVALLAVALLVVLRANPFFVQERAGHRHRTFRILKLRTLPPATPRNASKLALDIEGMNLPWLCAFLRRSHLDELPQLFLVPLGRMSLVGPRPRMMTEIVPDDFDVLRRAVRPGCTGLWQISTAKYTLATAAPRFDLFYLRYSSLRLDLWIALRTVTNLLGVTQPIEVGDVPAWALGSGLVAGSTPVTKYATAAIDERQEVEAFPQSRTPTTAETAVSCVVRDDVPLRFELAGMTEPVTDLVGER
jgi:lipopolysaccharide/colanic/teichoic acid biosynthesis glycosyltransferase